MTEEILVLRLLSMHNLQFMTDVTLMIRKAITENRFLEAKKEFYDAYFQGKLPFKSWWKLLFWLYDFEGNTDFCPFKGLEINRLGFGSYLKFPWKSYKSIVIYLSILVCSTSGPKRDRFF